MGGVGDIVMLGCLQQPWKSLDAITAAGSAPGVAARDAATLEAAAGVELITPDWRTRWLHLRGSQVADGDDFVAELLAMWGVDDYYTRIATITCKAGKQDRGTGAHFWDTITVSNAMWPDYANKLFAIDGAGGDRIAQLWIDTLEAKRIAVVPTTVDSQALIEYREMTG